VITLSVPNFSTGTDGIASLDLLSVVAGFSVVGNSVCGAGVAFSTKLFGVSLCPYA
jgi:hypothetical protein